MDHFDALQAWAPWVLAGVFALVAALELAIPARPENGVTLRRSITNLLLGCTVQLFALLVPFTLIAIAQWIVVHGAAPWPMGSWPLAVSVVAMLLLRTLSAYWAHRASHYLGWLWRVHHVHHSDTAIDVTTGLRHHPLEHIIALLFAMPTIWLFAPPVLAVALVELLLAVAGLFEHANIRSDGRIWRAARWVLVTPPVHLVHHSSAQPQTDSNYGPLLCLWDQLFGTWRDPLKHPVVRIGLGDRHDAVADRWAHQMLAPFLADP